MTNTTHHNVWIGVDVSQASRKPLEYLSKDILSLMNDHGMEFTPPEQHHMTLAYYKTITDHHLLDVLNAVAQLKEKNHHIQVVNPGASYDQTLHKIHYRKSNINNQIYFVLLPHNPDSVYREFIQNQHINPHISLGSTTNMRIEDVDKLLPKIKNYRDIIIKDCPITVDLSKIHIKF